jgi:hypothetical protein
VAGLARRYQVAQQQVVVENIRDRTKTDSQTTTADDPDWATILTTFINKRNSTSFLGWATGSVLCTGITELADGETANGADDNGDGLVDEAGFAVRRQTRPSIAHPGVVPSVTPVRGTTRRGGRSPRRW